MNQQEIAEPIPYVGKIAIVILCGLVAFLVGTLLWIIFVDMLPAIWNGLMNNPKNWIWLGGVTLILGIANIWHVKEVKEFKKAIANGAKVKKDYSY